MLLKIVNIINVTLLIFLSQSEKQKKIKLILCSSRIYTNSRRVEKQTWKQQM